MCKNASLAITLQSHFMASGFLSTSCVVVWQQQKKENVACVVSCETTKGGVITSIDFFRHDVVVELSLKFYWYRINISQRIVTFDLSSVDW